MLRSMQAAIVVLCLSATSLSADGLFFKSNDTRERATASFEYLDGRTGVARKTARKGNSPASGDTDGDGDSDQVDASEIARQTSNPLGGDFMILINEFTYTKQKSPIPAWDGADSFTQIFQPVIPISMANAIGPNWILVNRPTIPYIWDATVPGSSPLTTRSLDGYADISHFSLLGTSTPSDSGLLGPGDLVVAGGFSVNIPTGSSSLSQNVWALGPAATVAYIGRDGILGGLLQTQFDFFDGSTSDYNRAFFQPFYFVNLDNGWQIGGTPLMTFNFDSDEHSIPIGLGVQKTHVFDLANGGKMPVRFGLEARYFVEQPDAFGDDWSLVFQITPIIPNVVGNLLQGCPAMSVGGC